MAVGQSVPQYKHSRTKHSIKVICCMIISKRKPLTLPKLKEKAQRVFNAYIKNRDINKGCISCGDQVTEAGHYYSMGHFSGLRFNEMNTNGQCTRCNCFMHGNLIHYRFGLLRRYGSDKLHLLESAATRNSFRKWSRAELEIIIDEYQQKLKAA